MTEITIETIKDLEKIEEAIINKEEFQIKEIKSITYKLKFDGGRFSNYNIEYIDKFIAETILLEDKNYEKLLKELEKLYNIEIEEDKRELKFKLEKGSLDVSTDITPLVKEVLKNMESIHKVYVVIIVVFGFVASYGIYKLLEFKKAKLEEQSKIKARELEGEEQKRYLDNVNQAIEAVKDIANNVTIQKAINEPKQKITNMLEDNETLTINDDTTHKITKNDADKFEIVQPEVEDIEEEKTDTYKIKSYDFVSEGKLFKIEGIKPKAISETLSADKRLLLITKAEEGEAVKLKLKIIKDSLTNQIKKVYILDYIED
jgi:hypothetical protein